MILDVGCGYRKLGDINIDIDPEKKPDIIADAQYLPIKDWVFYKIFCYEVIEHIHNPFKLLSEIKRVLKANGTVKLSTPNPYQYRRIYREILKGGPIDYSLDHIACWSKSELKNLFEVAGLIIEKIDYDTLKWHELKHHRFVWIDKLIPSKVLVNYQIISELRKKEMKR